MRPPHYSVGRSASRVMFYLLFGLSLGRDDQRPKASEYLLASYAVFGSVTAALFAFGVGVVNRAGVGLDAPEAGGAAAGTVYLASKVLTCMLFGGVIVSLLGVLGMTVRGRALRRRAVGRPVRGRVMLGLRFRSA